MVKMCKKCGKMFSNRMIIEGKERNLSSRKFCVVCSPFGKHNTKNLIKDVGICIKCGNQGRIKGKGLCTACYQIQYYKKRAKKHKKMLLDEFNNKCSICGYDECIDILEFHHVRPCGSDLGVKRILAHSFENILKEAKKCILVCPNCHSKLHLKMGK